MRTKQDPGIRAYQQWCRMVDRVEKMFSEGKYAKHHKRSKQTRKELEDELRNL